MTGEDDISRRVLLGSLGTVGCAGAVFGTGTTALFTDREVFQDSVVRAGLLDILVSWEENGVIQTSEDGTATVTFDLADGEDTTVLTVEHADSRSNPANVWFRPTCPTGPADAVDVTLYVCGKAVSSGSLLQVANNLRNGFLLDQDCSGCLGPDEEIELKLESEFSETDDYNAKNPKDVELEFQYRAIQCRNNETPSNPFEAIDSCQNYKGISFIQIWADKDGDGCEDASGDSEDFVGKLELLPDYCGQDDGIDENHIEPDRYDLYNDGDDCNLTDYDVKITDTVEKVDGTETETTAVEFELLEDGKNTGPDLCRVDIKGGPGEAVYDDPKYFDGNATEGLLYAPVENSGNPGGGPQ